MGERQGLKRRISASNLAPPPSAIEASAAESSTPGSANKLDNASKKAESRGRSTSTSVVVPQTLEAKSPTIIAVPTAPVRLPPAIPRPTTWQPLEHLSEVQASVAAPAEPESSSRAVRLLTSAYNAGESSIRRLAMLVHPSSARASEHHQMYRRGSDDSEKGLATDSDATTTRSSEDSTRSSSRGSYWGLWKSQEADEADGYFSSPATPPSQNGEEKAAPSLAQFEAALAATQGMRTTLPTPAISAHSLSGRTGGSRRGRKNYFSAETSRGGWLKAVVVKYGSGKTGEVIRELGWTVAGLGALFFVTLGIAFWLLKSMPITTLKHVPSSTTDLQLLSAEIRAYMSSGSKGWWHTILVLICVGCWKHAWSVPGAVILNVLVGSLLDPMPALLLLTIITATGSLGSYMLSRPLAPLISVLFPKPLALVRAALAPDSVPSPAGPSGTAPGSSSFVTPVHVSSDPASPAIGADPASSASGSTAIWRRLLIMRSMGIVPWSGMNVACGVVGVDWKIFWLTTAAGSASWSYVTASVGNILSRLAIPAANAAASAAVTATDAPVAPQGESIASLLRDPVLIAKLVFLTGLTLIPVLFKRKSSKLVPSSTFSEASILPAASTIDTLDPSYPTEKPTAIPLAINPPRIIGADLGLSSPATPLTASVARFAPTPAAFDLLSFGRTVARQGINIVSGTAGSAVSGVKGLVGR